MKSDAIKQVGGIVAEYRSRHGQVLTQEKLAEAIKITRTEVAYLEEGRQLPSPEHLSMICRHLEIPERYWIIATHPYYLGAMDFEMRLSELIGRIAAHGQLEAADQIIAVDRIQTLFTDKLNETQSHAQFNSIMVVYGERPVTAEFFSYYFGINAFRDIESWAKHIRRFQADAMRLYGNFRRGWTSLSRCIPLEKELEPLRSHSLSGYESRTPFSAIKEIPTEHLQYLGYIAANRIKTENLDRQELSNLLNELADSAESKGGGNAVQDLAPKRLRRIQVLLRRFDVDISLEHGLFTQIDPELLRAHAQRLIPEESDLILIDNTQKQGLKNLAAYLTEPYMDVYVATSMREDADFVSVNGYVKRLFEHESVRSLNLRYFNPTQSWIEDRVSKGLVEALMLRRSRATIYMAQKSDTFGKDSEASVALGQGKTVIVYVPRLYDALSHIDSGSLYQMSEHEIDNELNRLGLDVEEGIDTKGKVRFVLQEILKRESDEAFKRIVANHWADFDLYGELFKIENDNLKKQCSAFLRAVRTSTPPDTAPNPDQTVKQEMADRLAAVAEMFESRARTFRDIHPLSLQVIVRSGVVNGILVTRSVDVCAKILRDVLANSLDVEVEVDDCNYRLVEKNTKSTLRVVSRHHLLTNAFWSQYFDEPYSIPELNQLSASTV